MTETETPLQANARKLATYAENERDAYELATLAAQICPDLCAKSPQEAIKKARALLGHALGDVVIREHEAAERFPKAMAELRERQLADRLKEIERQLAGLSLPYDSGIRDVTGQQRLYLARERFERFISAEEGRNTKAVLAHYGRSGFSGTELNELQAKYVEWWAKSHRRAKQGQVADKQNDARLQPRLPREFGNIVKSIAEKHGCTFVDALDTIAIEAGFDSIRQPAKPVVLTKDEKARLHAAAVKRGWKEKLPGSFATRKAKRHEKGDRGWTKDAERPLSASVKKAQRPDSMKASQSRPPLKAQRLR